MADEQTGHTSTGTPAPPAPAAQGGEERRRLPAPSAPHVESITQDDTHGSARMSDGGTGDITTGHTSAKAAPVRAAREGISRPRPEPSTPDVYAVTPPELPASMRHRLTSEDIAAFTEAAQRAGLTPNQAQEIASFYVERVKASGDARYSPEQTRAELQSRWGAEYPRKVALAQMMVRDFGSEALVRHLEATGAGNDPAVIEYLAGLGERVHRVRAAGVSPDRETAARQVKLILDDPTHAYWNSAAWGHREAVQRVTELLAIADGSPLPEVPTTAYPGGAAPQSPPAPAPGHDESLANAARAHLDAITNDPRNPYNDRRANPRDRAAWVDIAGWLARAAYPDRVDGVVRAKPGRTRC